MVAGRNGLDGAKAGMFDSARQDEVAVQPVRFGSDLGEGHADLESDAGLLRENPDRSDVAKRRNNRAKERADGRGFAAEMAGKVVAAAGVRLIGVGELPPACLAPP
jgi:hypothetical protein